MKLAIIYDSKTGNTAKMAEYIIEGITSVSGVEAKAFSIDAIDEAYIKDSSALIIGTPTYNGYLTARMKAWLESTPAKLNVAGKLGGAYAILIYFWQFKRLGRCLQLLCGWIDHSALPPQ